MRYRITTRYSLQTFTHTVATQRDGCRYITRFCPYDDTEYHWALESSRGWRIIRNGHTCTVTPRSVSPEEIARILLEADRKEHLAPKYIHN